MKVSRKLQLAVVVVTATWLGASSRILQTPSAPVQAAQVRQAVSGEVRLGDWNFPDTLNPVQGKSGLDRLLEALIWDDLVRFDDHSRSFGDLAAQVPTVANGLVTMQGGEMFVTIKLRSGLQWSDGQPITAEDVRFGWQVYSSTETGPACAFTCDSITAIDTPDTRTAVLHLVRSFGDYLAHLPPVLPEHAFGSVDDAAHKIGQDSAYNYVAPGFVTSGPYEVTNPIPEEIHFSPNPHYSALPGPYLSMIRFGVYSAKPSMIASAAARLVDVTHGYTIADLPELEKHTDGYRLHVIPSDTLEYLYFNTAPAYSGKPNPLSDLKVRQAINMVIRPADVCMAVLSDAQLCRGLAQNSPIGPNSTVNVTATPLANDVEGARALLASSAFKNQSLSLDCYSTSGSLARQSELMAISQALSQIGITCLPNYVPASTLLGSASHEGTLATGTYQVALAGLQTSLYPDSLVSTFGSGFIPTASDDSTTNQNYMRIDDANISSAFATAGATPDDSIRAGAFTAIAQRIITQAYGLTLFALPDISTSDPVIGNYQPSAEGTSWNAFEWYDTRSQTSPPANLTPTAAPTPTPTSAPTVTPTPLPRIAIRRVAILYSSKGRLLETRSLRLGQQATFLMEYDQTNQADNTVRSSLTVTKAGRQIGTFAMEQTTYERHSAFLAQVRFIDPHATGALYAHFRLAIGPSASKRDRKFTVRPR